MSAPTKNSDVKTSNVSCFLYEAKYNLALLAKEAGSYEEAIGLFSQVPWDKARIEERQVSSCILLAEELKVRKGILQLCGMRVADSSSATLNDYNYAFT